MSDRRAAMAEAGRRRLEAFRKAKEGKGPSGQAQQSAAPATPPKPARPAAPAPLHQKDASAAPATAPLSGDRAPPDRTSPYSSINGGRADITPPASRQNGSVRSSVDAARAEPPRRESNGPAPPFPPPSAAIDHQPPAFLAPATDPPLPPPKAAPWMSHTRASPPRATPRDRDPAGSPRAASPPPEPPRSPSPSRYLSDDTRQKDEEILRRIMGGTGATTATPALPSADAGPPPPLPGAAAPSGPPSTSSRGGVAARAQVLQDHVNDLTQENYRLVRAAEDARSAAAEAELAAAQLRQELAQAQSDAAAARRDADRLDGQLNAQGLALAAMAAERDGARRAAEDAASRAQALASEVIACEEALRRERAEVAKLRSGGGGWVQERGELQRRLGRATEALAGAERERDALLQQLEGVLYGESDSGTAREVAAGVRERVRGATADAACQADLGGGRAGGGVPRGGVAASYVQISDAYLSRGSSRRESRSGAAPQADPEPPTTGARDQPQSPRTRPSPGGASPPAEPSRAEDAPATAAAAPEVDAAAMEGAPASARLAADALRWMVQRHAETAGLRLSAQQREDLGLEQSDAVRAALIAEALGPAAAALVPQQRGPESAWWGGLAEAEASSMESICRTLGDLEDEVLALKRLVAHHGARAKALESELAAERGAAMHAAAQRAAEVAAGAGAGDAAPPAEADGSGSEREREEDSSPAAEQPPPKRGWFW
ncbi:unnamed protein product [Pedinophyceae sp. YPF-701]|nr:unnamed protein product [Pedinophyceae sp. YPF-701]